VSLRIEETFELRAPVDRTWRYLIDPRQLVSCLPGAELTEVRDNETFLGSVRLKVGPVTTAYDGRVTITGRDDVAHVVSLSGEGHEHSGTGSATMTITSRLTPISVDTTRVQFVADVDIVSDSGRLAPALIDSVNRQLFRQFTERLRGTLEESSDGIGEFGTEDPPAAWVPPPTVPRSPTAIPTVPPPSASSRSVVLFAARSFGHWLRRLGVGLIGRPRHP
jgi:carbon monoxide dehydrogenase subunit G